MEFGVSHDWEEETLEAKARWFRSKPIEERMRLFSEFTEMFLKLNPRLPDMKPDVEYPCARVRILRLP